jgi:hypothetical protein
MGTFTIDHVPIIDVLAKLLGVGVSMGVKVKVGGVNWICVGTTVAGVVVFKDPVPVHPETIIAPKQMIRNVITMRFCIFSKL